MSETEPTPAPTDAPSTFATEVVAPEPFRPAALPGPNTEWAKEQSQRLAPLRDRLDAMQQLEVDALKKTLETADSCKHLQHHAAALRDEANAAKRARDRIDADRTLSDVGRAQRRAEVDAKYAASLEKLDASAQTAINAIARAGDPRNVSLTADLAATVSMLWSRAEKLPARAVIEAAAADMAIALDDKATWEVRYAANVRLREFHSGWLARIDEAPPNHYKPYAATISELRETVDRHVDVMLGGYRRRAAESFAEVLQSDWQFAHAVAAKDGAFDDFAMSVGSPRLYGHLQRGR